MTNTAKTPTPEARWIEWLKTAENPRAALRAFCPHYFYFSYRQVVAFPGLFSRVDPLDRVSLAMLADVLYEELGRSDPARVHSCLFEEFAAAVGIPTTDILIDERDVLPGVRAYVAELDRAFREGSQADALATYVFLESSAVDTYEPLVTTLEALGFGDDIEFFRLHAGVEPEHAAAASAMLHRHGLSEEDPAVADQRHKLAALWHAFWSEIDAATRAASRA